MQNSSSDSGMSSWRYETDTPFGSFHFARGWSLTHSATMSWFVWQILRLRSRMVWRFFRTYVARMSLNTPAQIME